MSATLVPPPVVPPNEEGVRPSDTGGNGGGGRNIEERHYGGGDNPEGDPDNNPERWSTPLSAYRTVALFAIFSITSVFATLTHILAARWVNSRDWIPLALPHILYLNTGVLLISSLTIEVARFSLAREAFHRSVRWLWVTLILGIAFVAGQIIAWKAFVLRGLYLSSNPGSFFFYFLTGAHGLHLLVGIAALCYVIAFSRTLVRRGRQRTALSTLAFYWHFMDGLWLYLFILLFMTVQR